MVILQEFSVDLEDLTDKVEILKALAHPVRLCIVRGLLYNEGCNVSKMQGCIDIPQSTLSQHLAKLRDLKIVKSKRNGVEMNYYLDSKETERIVKALFPEGKFKEKLSNFKEDKNE